MSRATRILLACGTAVASVLAAAGDAASSPAKAPPEKPAAVPALTAEQRKRVEIWLQELGDPSFQKREGAQRGLEEWVARENFPAREVYRMMKRKVDESGDLEIRNRLEGLLSDLAERGDGGVFVSDCEWGRVAMRPGDAFLRDCNPGKEALSVAGKKYRKGIRMHPFADQTPAEIAVSIDGKGFVEFISDVGVNDDADGRGSVEFIVLVDGKEMARSPVLKVGEVHSFRVDVAGSKEVVLRVMNGGNGNECDHAVWGGARFIAKERPEPGPANPAAPER